uniref:No apical meristem-associated C-terminal domain-containing protein n=1 Tax=Brassica oleracea var. oleracea TaxID=109376 RepID=A0A0D3AMX7_BRAOL
MDYNPYTQSPRFVELLNSQQDSVFRLVEESQGTEASSQFRLVEESQATPAERRVRRKWIPTDDIVLISSWLNTSKDPVALNREKLATVSSDGTRSMILSPSFVDVMKRQQGRKVELRNDQKWCDFSTSKTDGIFKRRKCEDSTQSSSSHATGEADQGTIRPLVLRQQRVLDLAIKERLSKMSLLDSLLAKKKPLTDYEEALKKKLINDLLSI